MLDLDSSVSKFPSWRNPFVEDGESLVSELLNYDQRFPDFSFKCKSITWHIQRKHADIQGFNVYHKNLLIKIGYARDVML